MPSTPRSAPPHRPSDHVCFKIHYCCRTKDNSTLADRDVRSLEDARLGRTLGKSRRLIIVVVGSLVLFANVLDRAGTGLGDGSSVAVVGVDADEVLAVGSLDVVDGDLACFLFSKRY
jgi:hypothetical protein